MTRDMNSQGLSSSSLCLRLDPLHWSGQLASHPYGHKQGWYMNKMRPYTWSASMQPSTFWAALSQTWDLNIWGLGQHSEAILFFLRRHQITKDLNLFPQIGAGWDRVLRTYRQHSSCNWGVLSVLDFSTGILKLERFQALTLLLLCWDQHHSHYAIQEERLSRKE